MISSRPWRNAADQSGFTVIELLVVAVIIIILSLLAIPIYASVTDTARLSRSSNDLRQVETALERYKAEYGHYPQNLHDLVDANYLKRGFTFESAWSSSENRIYLFYAVDRKANAQAFILADPGPGAPQCSTSSGEVVEERTMQLSASAKDPFPCGRHPESPNARHWAEESTPKLTLIGATEIPESIRGWRESCDPTSMKTDAAKVQCVYKAER